MGFLLMLSRKIQLEDRRNDLEYQINTINTKMNDLTNYASILSQDSISVNDMANIPSSLFAQGLGELANCDMFAKQNADNNMGMAMSSGIFGQTANQNVQGLAWQKMYEEASKQYRKMLQAKMNEEEKSLESRKARLDAQFTELKHVEQREAQDIQSAVAGYGVGGQ